MPTQMKPMIEMVHYRKGHVITATTIGTAQAHLTVTAPRNREATLCFAGRYPGRVEESTRNVFGGSVKHRVLPVAKRVVIGA